MAQQMRFLLAACAVGAVATLSTALVSAQPKPTRAGKSTPNPAPASASAIPLPAPPAGGEMGFMLSAFYPAVYPGKENCPDGYANTNSENYLAMLPAAERARLSKKENEVEFTTRWKAASRGEDNTNLCTNYDQFPERPLQKLVQGKTAIGLDLDGDDGKSRASESCAHESFDGPSGESGVDNQAYRVMGCMRGWRAPDGGAGDMTTFSRAQIKTGEFAIVVLLRGVDSLIQDDDVQVIVASTLDIPMIDSTANFIAGATFSVAPNPRWRNVLHGRIRDGVLTTGRQTITVRQPVYENAGPRLQRYETEFSSAKLQIRFQPDGTMKGTLGGYLPLYYFLTRMVAAGLGTTDTVNLDCAAVYNTLQKYADGGRDPKTGRCTKVSTAFEMTGIPAYIKDTPARTAEARR